MIYDQEKENRHYDIRYYFLSLISYFFAIAILSLISYLLFPKITDASVILQRPPSQNLGLVGYWTMDGKDTNWASNTMVDRSGQGNTGTLTNMSTTTSPAIGKIGQALYFDGVNDVLSAGSDFIGTGEDSVSAWIYPRSFGEGSFGTIISNMGISLNTYDATNALIFTSNNYTNSASSAAIFPARFNTWIHVTVTRTSSGTANIYIDGVLSGSANQNSGTPVTGSTNVNIGNRTSSLDQTFDGYIDDVRFYNRVLSVSEISRLYQAGSTKVAGSATLDNGSSLENGLVGLWTMDGKDTNWGNSTTLDKSGNGNTGTMTNMSTTTSPTVGKIGQSLKFDGSDDYVNLGTGSSLNITGAMSVSAWIKVSALTTEQFIVDRWTWAGDNYRAWSLDFGGATAQPQLLVFRASVNGTDGGVSEVNYDFTGNTNKWVFVTGVYNGTNMYLYVNGVQVDSDTGPASIFSTNQATYIGAGNIGATNLFNGSIDDVRIYNRALSSTEITKLYRLGADKINASQNITGGSLDQGLVGLWSLDGKDINWATNQAFDRSGQGNHGTMTNMSTTTSPAVGKIGQSLKFDGSDDYVNTGASNVSAPCSVSAWVYLNSRSSVDYPLVTSVSGGGYSFRPEQWGTDDVGITIIQSFDHTFSSPTYSVPLNTWTHLVFVVNTGNATLYANGVQQGTISASLACPRSRIGQESGTEALNGKIDDVRIYNRALSASEIKQLYNMGR